MLLVTGCDSRPAPSAVSPARPRVKPQDVHGAGVVRGHVKLDGPAPEMKVIPNQPCHDAAEPIRDETVVIGAGGGLKNAFVYVTSQDVQPVDGATLDPAVLDQKSCQYVPHVVGVCVNQALRVRSSDPTVHNVHYAPQGNPSGNLTMNGPDEKTVTFTSPEFVRMKCDVHPWMTAYVGVFDTPFFAVTGDDGGYEIKGLPPGQYELLVWHERYGQLQQSVTVSETASKVELSYRAPQ